MRATAVMLRMFALMASVAALPLSPAFAAPAPAQSLPATVEFNRDIRPLLSENCYFCHGPDKNKRKADLRLDTKGGLFDEIDKVHPIVPGRPQDSDLFRRITTDDPDDRMPPAKSNKKLTAAQIALVKRWIEQGAPWEGHWAYQQPKHFAVPTVASGDTVLNPIDAFVLERLHEHGLQPGVEADKITLCRRLYFDLLGLPPTPEQVQAFVEDSRLDAYEKLVDQLLADPHFGERMAVSWLDQVRYADSMGYHSDNPVNVTPYRDWVIAAFNQNMPFDQFTIKQLAGDLLPHPTIADKVASCYNRLLQTTEEGGAQPKEYIAKYASDRVRNVSAVWMAQTMGCCECHDHKFDPLTTREFYSMEAFFADIQEASVGPREPGMAVPSAEQQRQLADFDAKIADAKKQLQSATASLHTEQEEWEKRAVSSVKWTVIDPIRHDINKRASLEKLADGVLLHPKAVNPTEAFIISAKMPAGSISGVRLEVMPDPSLPANGPGASQNGNFVLTQILVQTIGADKKPHELPLSRAIADFSQDNFPVSAAIDDSRKNDPNNGWAILPQTGQAHEAIFELAHPQELAALTELQFTLRFASQYAQHSIGKLRLSSTASPQPVEHALPKNISAALAIAASQRTAAQKAEITQYFESTAPELKPLREKLASLETQKRTLTDSLPLCLVSISGPPRTIHILPRGNWLNETQPVVSPVVPAAIGKLSMAKPNERPTRLDLAKWIASKDNPLTARVYVNRLWKMFYGVGIAAKVDDFGSQGDWPTHPKLLDWLACDFMDSGWDTKQMIRLMVTSRTYRLTSVPTDEQQQIDPANQWLSHQNRYRLDAEFVRDNALSISGLLADHIGGRSVFPYQPPGYWSFLNFPPREWQNDTGENLYRRGLYTHCQRTFLQPSLLAFDAPSREEAVCERTRSNVPQQALAMLNDPTYVEAARVFAEHIVRSGSSDSTRLDFAFEKALQRAPRPQETQILTDMLQKHLAEYAANTSAAKELTSVGSAPVAKDLNVNELAAWTNVARAILNLHETITRN